MKTVFNATVSHHIRHKQIIAFMLIGWDQKEILNFSLNKKYWFSRTFGCPAASTTSKLFIQDILPE